MIHTLEPRRGTVQKYFLQRKITKQRNHKSKRPRKKERKKRREIEYNPPKIPNTKCAVFCILFTVSTQNLETRKRTQMRNQKSLERNQISEYQKLRIERCTIPEGRVFI